MPKSIFSKAEADFLQTLSERMLLLDRENRLRRLSERNGIDLSSNDYLGLSEDRELLDRFRRQAGELTSFGSCGSRLLRGNISIHERCEMTVEKWRGGEAALLFSSGYDANCGILSTLPDSGDHIFSDRSNHTSIIEGCRLSPADLSIFGHNDLDQLEDLLKRTKAKGHRFIVVESIYSMDGDSPNFRDLFLLANRYDALLIVDEAHATGCVGQIGRGEIDDQGVDDLPLISLHTAGKALAGSGACVVCPDRVKQWLINKCRNFIYTTAPSPYASLWFILALEYQMKLDDRRSILKGNAHFVRERFHQAGLLVEKEGKSPIIPLVIGDPVRTKKIAGEIVRHGFDVRAILAPTVAKGTERLRISVNTKISKTDLERFVALVIAVFKEAG